MNVDTYFSSVLAGFEFLIALGSLIGSFGLVVGALLLFLGGRPFKSKGLKILLISGGSAEEYIIKTLDVEPEAWCDY